MRSPVQFSAFILACAFVVAGCGTAPLASSHGTEEQVRAVLQRQVAEWNRGNLSGFMETYAKSDSTRFASGADVSLGWKTVFGRYRKNYGDRAAMGTLSFSELEVTVFSPDAALAFGRWHLRREQTERANSGLFTLVLRKLPEGWRIVHDHTSAEEKN